MPTAAYPEYVELVGASSTLLIGSRGISMVDDDGLGQIGGSRGSDLTYAQVDGAVALPRYRGVLTVTMTLHIDGQWDEDGDVAADPIANGWVMRDAVLDWPDDNDRECTLEWTRPSGTVSGVARFEAFGRWVRPAAHVHEVDILLTVPAGRLT